MANKRVTLSFDSKICEEYKKYCDKKGLIISKQFENLTKEGFKKGG